MSREEQILVAVHRKRLEEEHLYSNFENYYSKKDFVKASEFLWGSVANIAYALGLLLGTKLGRHKEIIAFMRELAKGDLTIIDEINSAESLHSNFYHNWMEETVFESYVRKVVDLRIWLTRLLNQETEKAILRLKR